MIFPKMLQGGVVIQTEKGTRPGEKFVGPESKYSLLFQLIKLNKQKINFSHHLFPLWDGVTSYSNQESLLPLFGMVSPPIQRRKQSLLPLFQNRTTQKQQE
jgi:hypothetical protein